MLLHPVSHTLDVIVNPFSPRTSNPTLQQSQSQPRGVQTRHSTYPIPDTRACTSMCTTVTHSGYCDLFRLPQANTLTSPHCHTPVYKRP